MVQPVDNKLSADDIRLQMARVRQHLDHDVDEIIDGAGRMADWRNYVASAPWLSLAAATALGYFVVPRRLEIVSPDAKTLEKLAKSNRLVVEHRPRADRKSGLMDTAFRLASHTLLRAGIAYLGRQAGKHVGHQAVEESLQGST